jgi:hypothetical protein
MIEVLVFWLRVHYDCAESAPMEESEPFSLCVLESGTDLWESSPANYALERFGVLVFVYTLTSQLKWNLLAIFSRFTGHLTTTVSNSLAQAGIGLTKCVTQIPMKCKVFQAAGVT